MSASNAMFCHNCGVPQSDDANFCGHCGARQTLEAPELLGSIEGARANDGADPAQSAPPNQQVESIEPALPEERAPASENRRHIVEPEEASASVSVTAAAPIRPERKNSVWAGVLWLVTAGWVSLVSFHAYANWPLLSQLGVNGMWDFLIRATAPLVLFWLVMGHIRFAAKMRDSEALNFQAARLVGETEQAAAVMSDLVKQAQAAVHTVSAEIQKLRDQEQANLRAVQPRWEVNGRLAHEKVHEINLRNAGAAATGLNAVWDKSVPMAVILSDTAFIDRGGHLTLKAMFLEERLDEFELKLQYCDGANHPRVAEIAVSNREVAIRHDEV